MIHKKLGVAVSLKLHYSWFKYAQNQNPNLYSPESIPLKYLVVSLKIILFFGSKSRPVSGPYPEYPYMHEVE